MPLNIAGGPPSAFPIASCDDSSPAEFTAPGDGNQLSDVLFSESPTQWHPLPNWVEWFLRFGYLWPIRQSSRRICILSVPCESPAAALIALGLMRRRLELRDAGDLASHLGRLRDLFSTAREGTVLRRVNNRKRFRFLKVETDGTLWVHPHGDASRYKIIEERACDWYVDGEPQVQGSGGAPLLVSGILHTLFKECGAVLPENLDRTDSAICLAGRVGGESQTHEALSAVQFRLNENVTSLGALLTVYGWHEGRVSRVTFYNSRTSAFDRQPRLPLAVSADGGSAFLRVHADSRFRASDIIAVIPRTSDADQLETVAQQLASLSQWYTPGDDVSVKLPDAPAGVTPLVLRKD